MTVSAIHILLLTDLVADLPRTYEVFYALSDADRTCKHCGTVHPGKDYAAWHAIRDANA